MLLRVDITCEDNAILYEVQKQANAAASDLKDAKLVADKSATVIVRISVQPIFAEKKDTPHGVSLAALVTRVNHKGGEEIRRFTNQILPMSQYADAVRKIVSSVPK
jgi:hypothetical protein